VYYTSFIDVTVISSNCDQCLQGVSVEAVDPVFQAKMLDMLKQTGRPVSLAAVVFQFVSHVTFCC